MRLTQAQRQTIVDAARQAFSPDVGVRLFGSRIEDDRRGGDFDLYFETRLADPDQLIRAQERFLCLLDASPALEGEKIDVVLNSPLHQQPRPIDRVTRAEGIRL